MLLVRTALCPPAHTAQRLTAAPRRAQAIIITILAAGFTNVGKALQARAARRQLAGGVAAC